MSNKETTSLNNPYTKYEILTNDNVVIDTNTINIWGEIDELLGPHIERGVNILKLYHSEIKKPLKEINLDINSHGGSIYGIYSVIDLFDKLLKQGIKVNTHANTICMSAATLVVASGTGVRTSGKKTKFLLHDIQLSGFVSSTAEQVIKETEELKKDKREMFELYSIYSNKGKELNLEELKKETDRWLKKYGKDSIDKYLTSSQMLELKLIDKIV